MNSLIKIPTMCWLIFISYILLSLCGWLFACLIKASIVFRFHCLPLPDFTRIFILHPNWILYQILFFGIICFAVNTRKNSNVEKAMTMLVCMIICATLVIFFILIGSVTPWLPVNPKLDVS